MKAPEDNEGIILMSFLLTLSRFGTLLFCIHCWLWTSNFLFERFKIGLKLSHFIPIFPAISITAQNWGFPLGIIHSVGTQNFTKKKKLLILWYAYQGLRNASYVLNEWSLKGTLMQIWKSPYMFLLI